MVKWYTVPLLAGLSLLSIVGLWVLLADDVVDPWRGYRWNKATGRLEWLAASSSLTRRECIEKVRLHLRNVPGDGGPIGCAFNGNNYWRVWLTNLLVDNPHVGCIANAEGLGANTRYQPVLGTPPDKGPPCLSPIEALSARVRISP